MYQSIRSLVQILLFLFLVILGTPVTEAENPAVRAITAFIRIDRAQYKSQIEEAISVLNQAKQEFEKNGYEVQYIRLTTQPFPLYIHGLTKEEALQFFKSMEALLPKKHFMGSIGPAMLSDNDDLNGIELLKEILPNSLVLYASNIVATEKGVQRKAVHASAELIKYLADHSKQSEANFAFSASALVPLNTPFFPVSYHTGAGRQFAIGLASTNLVGEAFSTANGDRESARIALQNSLNLHAAKIEEISQNVSKITGWEYMGLDTSVAPGFPGTRESIGAAIETLTGAPFGSSGTLAAAGMITEVIKAIPVKQIGYSGLMLPVMEDEILSKRWSEGRLAVDMLLAYSAVCGTGLDTVPLPGDISVEQLERIIADMATLSVKLRKPLAARLMPIAGKKPGETTEYDWLLKTKLQPLP
jgi:uncharacterized protein